MTAIIKQLLTFSTFLIKNNRPFNNCNLLFSLFQIFVQNAHFPHFHNDKVGGQC